MPVLNPEFKWWDYNGRLKTANGVDRSGCLPHNKVDD